MGAYCSRARDSVCGGCGFSCQCMTCERGDSCDCSCRWLVVGGMAFSIITALICVLAYKERRTFLATWSGIYFLTAAAMTGLTYTKGPDPHDLFGCSLPLSLWLGSMFVATMSYYTSDYMRRGQETDRSARTERYVYDPRVGEYVPVQELNEYRVE